MNIMFRRHHVSFRHAADGVVTAFKTQPNFKVHLVLSMVALALGFYFGISNIEWIVLFFVIAVGLAIELINTAIEFTVDLLTQEYKLLAKFAKDTSAGAMLIFAVFSTIIASVMFIPRFLALWHFI